MSDLADIDERITLAYTLARYIRRYPASSVSLAQRVKNLTLVSDAEIERLLPEVEYWLDLMTWQAKKKI